MGDLATIHQRRATDERRDRHQRSLRVANAAEQVILSAYGFPNADGYVNPRGEASAVGGKLRLYATTGGVRTLEAETVIGSSASPTRVSAAGRGCDSWDLAILLDPANPAPVNLWSWALTSFDGAATASSVLPSSGGTLPGLASWVDQYGSNDVIKSPGGQLLQVFGNVISLPATPRYLHIFDSPGAVPNGTAPLLRAALVPNGQWSLVLTDPSDPPTQPGRTFATGIVWAVSSTAQLLTLDAAAVVDLHAKYL